MKWVKYNEDMPERMDGKGVVVKISAESGAFYALCLCDGKQLKFYSHALGCEDPVKRSANIWSPISLEQAITVEWLDEEQ